MRLDKYLKVSRLIKRRTVANEVADAGRILINGKIAKASQAVKAGDVIEVTFGNRPSRVEGYSRMWNPAPRMWPAECTRSSAGKHIYKKLSSGAPRMHQKRGDEQCRKKTPKPAACAPHDLMPGGRARLTVTGVQKVLHCNADSAAIETGRGHPASCRGTA